MAKIAKTMIPLLALATACGNSTPGSDSSMPLPSIPAAQAQEPAPPQPSPEPAAAPQKPQPKEVPVLSCRIEDGASFESGGYIWFKDAKGNQWRSRDVTCYEGEVMFRIAPMSPACLAFGGVPTPGMDWIKNKTVDGCPEARCWITGIDACRPDDGTQRIGPPDPIAAASRVVNDHEARLQRLED